MERVAHDDRRTAFRVVEGDGGGPTTLYVHGSGGSHRVWARQYAPDGPTHPACALDLSGHGDSTDFDDDPEPERVLDAYVRDVVAVAEAVDATVLVGNSMGGAVVLQGLLEDDLDPDAVVLAGTGPRLPVDETLRTLLAADFEAALDVLHGTDVLFHGVDERRVERSKATMRAAGQAVLCRDFRACHRFDVRDRLDEIDVPVLAVVGEHDRLTPPAYHRSLADGMANCRYHELPGAAHLAMLDRPDAFDAALGEFLAEVV